VLAGAAARRRSVLLALSNPRLARVAADGAVPRERERMALRDVVARSEDHGRARLIRRAESDLVVSAAVPDVGRAAEAQRAGAESDVRRAGDAARVRLAVAADDVRVALDHADPRRRDVESIPARCDRVEGEIVLRVAALV